MRLRICALLLMAILTGGCLGPSATEYEVRLTNITATPVSAGFVKSNGRIEEGWVSPTDLTMMSPAYGSRHWGVAVKPGQTMTIGPARGHMEEGSLPLLQVYAGNLKVEELVAMSRRDPDRAEAILPPGPSAFVVTQREGRLTLVDAGDYQATDRRPGE
jgi:hypothetical protein